MEEGSNHSENYKQTSIKHKITKEYKINHAIVHGADPWWILLSRVLQTTITYKEVKPVLFATTIVYHGLKISSETIYLWFRPWDNRAPKPLVKPPLDANLDCPIRTTISRRSWEMWRELWGCSQLCNFHLQITLLLIAENKGKSTDIIIEQETKAKYNETESLSF